jgi:hypothetical protein
MMESARAAKRKQMRDRIEAARRRREAALLKRSASKRPSSAPTARRSESKEPTRPEDDVDELTLSDDGSDPVALDANTAEGMRGLLARFQSREVGERVRIQTLFARAGMQAPSDLVLSRALETPHRIFDPCPVPRIRFVPGSGFWLPHDPSPRRSVPRSAPRTKATKGKKKKKKKKLMKKKGAKKKKT